MTIDDLLERLSSGDPTAAEQVFQEYEPYLRMIVRRQIPDQLRGKFDSIDIVQSVWADLLQGFRDARWHFQDAGHLRAFLIQATRNRFVDHLRRDGRAGAREQSLLATDPQQLPPSPQPSPSEIAQEGDVWDQLLVLSRPEHREVLELKRRGLPLAEIAEQTRLHPSSIRRILYDLARQLAADEARRPEQAD